MKRLTTTKRKTHPPINSSKRKKTWNLFRLRDVNKDNEIICTVCQQPEIVGDKDYKLTIGHINVQSSKYEKYFNTNDEVNLTPQHAICNNRLKGRDFYRKNNALLMQILEKNIEWSLSQLSFKKEFQERHTVSEDSSSAQNKKSNIYDAKCEQYLDEILKTELTKVEFETAENDISSICQSIHGFGNQVSIRRHLKKICSPFYLKFITEKNEDSVEVIRLMRKEERQAYSLMLEKFKNNQNYSTFS